MAKDFLLEIGLEEMPAHVVSPSRKQLADKVIKFLKENHLEYANLKAYSTPRRLAIQIEGLDEQQADTKIEAKGPAKKIALDADGNWTKAAQGFARGQGLTVEDIVFKEIKGVPYAHVTKEVKGKTAAEVLLGIKDIVMNMTFPVSMYWGNYDFKFIRPIRWIVALLDQEVLPISILNVVAGRTTRGHRFLGKTVEIPTVSSYESVLQEQFVIADDQKRKQIIRNQANQIAEESNWDIDLDLDLLEEVTNLVEYPTVFYGSFDEKYLAVPEAVLVTSMKEHQRYFDVWSKDHQLLPYFISVRNGNQAYIDNVRKGNEKVLVARLEDAEFFYKEDQKLTIADYVNKLKSVTFHEKIGSIYEKMQRVTLIAQLLGQELGLNQTQSEDLYRASQIYKFDLVTGMVDEFPELQGIMGEKYALLQGEKPAVAKAIREHYMPVSSDGDLPESTIGSVLAVADKLDTLLCFFAVGLNPSGSNDPYALRRQAYGIIRIVEAKNWDFPVMKLQSRINEAINEDTARFGIEFNDAIAENAVLEFVKGRMKQFLSAHDIRHDIVDAVIKTEQDDLHYMVESAQVLKNNIDESDFKPTIEALTRVINLSRKGKKILSESTNQEVNPDLFENDSEKALYEAVNRVTERFENQTIAENYDDLKSLRPLIDSYFENTMVMAEDKEVAANRMRQLIQIAQMAQSIASLDLLLVK